MKLLNKKAVAVLILTSAVSVVMADNTMQIKISNDTADSIYPLITANNQHCVKKGDPILAGQSYVFNLTSECWNAGRVYIAKQPFTVAGDQPIGGKYQLAEYTFSNTGRAVVDYDFSAVDSLFTLPIAIEPIIKVDPKAPDYGYTGMSSAQTESSLQSAMDDFRIATGWPSFTNIPDKIPGGYNLFALTNDVDINQGQAATVRNKVIQNWYAWYDDQNYAMCSSQDRPVEVCHAFEDSVKNVINSFKENAKANNWQFKSYADEQYQIVEHILGFVPLGKTWQGITSTTNDEVIGLLRGVSSKSQEKAQSQYLFPDYENQYCLNPYVTFIHKMVKLNVYAFSIDDAVGNFYVPNYEGIQIDVGSIKSLPNQYPA